MRRDFAPDCGIRSAAIVPTLLLTLACFAVLAVVTLQAQPGWWSPQGAIHAPQVVTNGGVVTTNYVTNAYAVANQGQLKQFTIAAVRELNIDLASSGGAGSALITLTNGWYQDYLTNGYATNTANPYRPYKPSDFQAVNVGQLKYIASLVYTQLSAAGYTALTPSWIVQNTSTDNVAANLGQLKEVFDYDLSLAPLTNVTASANTGGTVNLGWTLPAGNTATSYIIEQQNTDGTWETIATLSNPLATSYSVTGLATGENPTFQVIAQNGRSVSLAAVSLTTGTLLPPANVTATPGLSAGEIDLTWINQATDATYIVIHQSTDGVNWTTIATLTDPTATSYPVTNLTLGQSYYFGVAAGN